MLALIRPFESLENEDSIEYLALKVLYSEWIYSLGGLMKRVELMYRSSDTQIRVTD